MLNNPDHMHRLAVFFALLAVTGTLLLTSFHIIGYGYLPGDDALRHTAKVLSGREWHEILVIRPEFSMDSHPGWHAALGKVRDLTNLGNLGLLNFSVLSLFLLFVLPPAFMLRRPEAWLLALLVMALLAFGAFVRTLYGRPLIFSMSHVLVFCFLWERLQHREKPRPELAALTLLAALSTWIHGTWYLLGLPLAALLLCRQWRALLLASVATSAGILLGALFTGRPLDMLSQTARHLHLTMGQHDFQRQLVLELHSFDGAPLILLLVGGILLWRQARGDWKSSCLANPVFVLAGLGWMLGFVAFRFWSDWGWPALTLWLAIEIQRILERHTAPGSLHRLGLVVTACLAFFLALGNDRAGRWSGSTLAQWPEMANQEHRPWLPEEGGTLYNDNMVLFYSTFFHNPRAPWRYILGFEPIWMPEEDLRIYRHIQLSNHRDDSYLPWVAKMTEADRMLLVRGARPTISGLDWHEVTPTVWSGRLAAEETADEKHP